MTIVRIAISALVAALWIGPARAAEVTPFYTVNQSPLTQILELAGIRDPQTLRAGRTRFHLSEDIANNYAAETNATERLILDGETYRTNFRFRYGLSDRLELGTELTVNAYGGGWLDQPIQQWHSTFGLPNGGRQFAPKNRMLFFYSRAGAPSFQVNHMTQGLGDLRVTGGWNLLDNANASTHDSLTVRSAIGIPTGFDGNLMGTGAFGGALYFAGSRNYFTSAGPIGIYGSIGGISATPSGQLSRQRNGIIGIASGGIGWGMTQRLTLKTQLDWNSAVYSGSALPELSSSGVMLTTGGSYAISPSLALDFAFSEDIAPTTAPDITFHAGLTKSF